MDYLKGNYQVKKKLKASKRDSNKESKQSMAKKFEEFAKANLGGSIAFVMKKDTFLWTGDK